MKADAPQIPTDPNLAQEQQQAQNTLIHSLQTQEQMDTANIMSRYGARLALASGGMAPATPASAPPVGGKVF
jgi:hypothetical protein